MREDIVCYSAKVGDLFEIDLAGRSYCDGTYSIKRNNSDVYVFEYVIKGRGTIELNNKKYTARAGDVYMLKKGTDHHYYSSEDDPWVKIWFNISGRLVDSLVSDYKLNDVVYSSCDAFSLFSDFISLAKNNRYNHMLGKFYADKFHEIISFMVFYRSADAAEDADTVKRYIDENISKNISIDEMSRLIFKSQSQTIRLFKKKYEVTPYKYLRDRKIGMAKTLLQNTNLSVKQIATELNFADEHYFSNVFKSCTAVCPSRFREAARSSRK